MHYFSAAFLADMARRMRAEARYHLARKAIPSVSGPVKARPRPGPIAAGRPPQGDAGGRCSLRACLQGPWRHGAGAMHPAYFHQKHAMLPSWC